VCHLLCQPRGEQLARLQTLEVIAIPKRPVPEDVATYTIEITDEDGTRAVFPVPGGSQAGGDQGD
jgi:hypothetical protein